MCFLIEFEFAPVSSWYIYHFSLVFSVNTWSTSSTLPRLLDVLQPEVGWCPRDQHQAAQIHDDARERRHRFGMGSVHPRDGGLEEIRLVEFLEIVFFDHGDDQICDDLLATLYDTNIKYWEMSSCLETSRGFFLPVDEQWASLVLSSVI